MAEFKDLEVNGEPHRVWGADADAVKDGIKTAREAVNLVALDVENPDHANLTFAEMQEGAAPVAAADPDPRDKKAE